MHRVTILATRITFRIYWYIRVMCDLNASAGSGVPFRALQGGATLFLLWHGDPPQGFILLFSPGAPPRSAPTSPSPSPSPHPLDLPPSARAYALHFGSFFFVQITRRC